MKIKHFIDSHKAVTGVAVFAMIAIHGQWDNATAWVYLALHGTYGTRGVWALKSRIFPDRSWEGRTHLGFGLLAWGALTLYWIAPWLLTSQSVRTPPWYLGMCIVLYTLGVFLHFTTDMFKHTALKLRPGHLITDGMLARCRNLNYFGELLVYLGVGLLAMHWIPLAILALFVGAYWVPRMIHKDQSLSRYAGFEEYKRQTKFFIPFLF